MVGIEQLDELHRAFALDDGVVGEQAVSFGVTAGASFYLGGPWASGGGDVATVGGFLSFTGDGS